tara:strand:- start:557 stop:889 length:333 start_codon:yes stop_codon:yes gene_type:complete
MSEIHKFIQEIELRIQAIELSQEETTKILVDFNTQLNMLKTQVTNTHQTFNLLIENVNNQQNKVEIVQNNGDTTSDSDSDSSYEKKKKIFSKNNKKTIKKNNTNQIRRLI